MKGLHKYLLIEDDQVSAFIGERQIKKLDPTAVCDHASNGEIAIKRILEQKDISPDVILLDLNMPIMNGWEFLEKYCKHFGEGQVPSRIVIVTSSKSQVDQDRAAEFGCVTGFISKPVKAEELQAILRESA